MTAKFTTRIVCSWAFISWDDTINKYSYYNLKSYGRGSQAVLKIYYKIKSCMRSRYREIKATTRPLLGPYIIVVPQLRYSLYTF